MHNYKEYKINIKKIPIYNVFLDFVQKIVLFWRQLIFYVICRKFRKTKDMKASLIPIIICMWNVSTVIN